MLAIAVLSEQSLKVQTHLFAKVTAWQSALKSAAEEIKIILPHNS
jgi:hypothetical protein